MAGSLTRVPHVPTSNRDLDQLQQGIASVVRKLSLNPIVNGTIVDQSKDANGHLQAGIQLKTGKTNHINHGLNRSIVGWVVVRQRGLASIYDAQDSDPNDGFTPNRPNPNPQLTVLLITSADVFVDIYFF